MDKRKIGYIGLGNMGGGMAANLVKNGYPVTVFDVSSEAVQRLVDLGATAAASPKEVAEASDIIITSLPMPNVVEQVALGDDGIVQGIGPGKTYIDMSTIDPDTTRRVGEAIKATGAEMLDVPVGKGPPAAASGNLTLMVGGDAEVVEDCKDVLDTLGSESFYCGGLGMGITTKLVNNLVSCSVATLLGEAFVIGTAAGLDPEILRNVMSNTAADTAHGRNSFKDRALARDFEPAFKLALAHKDLRLAGELAGSLGASNLIGSMAHQILTMGMGKGLGNEDQTASIKVAEEIAGVEVKRSDDTA